MERGKYILRKGDRVLCLDSAGKFKVWTGTVKSVLAVEGGKDPEAAIVYEGEPKSGDSQAHVVRVEDMAPLSALPEYLFQLLGRFRLVAEKPYEPFTGTAPTSPSAAAVEDLEIPEGTPTSPPLYIKIEPQGVPEGFDWSTMAGQPYHDQDRRPIGLVMRAGQGKAVVVIRRGLEEQVRAMMAGGALPGAVECSEPKPGESL